MAMAVEAPMDTPYAFFVAFASNESMVLMSCLLYGATSTPYAAILLMQVLIAHSFCDGLANLQLLSVSTFCLILDSIALRCAFQFRAIVICTPKYVNGSVGLV